MKLSEALALRADLNKRIAEVTQRMVDNAKFQEGTKPAEDSAVLLQRLEEMAAQLQNVIAQINKTNIATRLADGRTLTEAIAERDILLVRIAYHRRLAEGSLIKQSVLSQMVAHHLKDRSDSLQPSLFPPRLKECKVLVLPRKHSRLRRGLVPGLPKGDGFRLSSSLDKYTSGSTVRV